MHIQAISLFIIACLAIGIGCDKNQSSKPKVMKVKIGDEKGLRDVFKKLLKQKNANAFVVIEELASKMFVQFAGARDVDLLLDLPHQPLGDDGMKRAGELFAEYGVNEPEKNYLYDENGNISFTQITYQMDLGKDVDKAAEITKAIFENVYMFSPDMHVEARFGVGPSESDIRNAGWAIPPKK